MNNSKLIFVTGGVMSSLGKGLAAASLGAILQARGFSVCIRKFDPYLNIDPGTLSPYQHGEVFVTNDGAESDLDLGHYERYTGRDACSSDYLTTGRVYSDILSRERKGEYLGSTVQVIPHITDEIKRFIKKNDEDFDFIITEVGGTVGDIEGLPALEAVRQLRNEQGYHQTMFVHLTYIPNVFITGEQKTKPTQHSVKALLQAGIQPDLLLCRSSQPLHENIKGKLALFCNVHQEDVIAALDVTNIYRVPLNYSIEKFDERVCKHFLLNPLEHKISENWLKKWENLTKSIDNPTKTINIVIFGKYVDLEDSYKSLKEAITHAAGENGVKVNIIWCNAEKSKDIVSDIKEADAIIVPGGFGVRGTENMIKAIQYAREKKVPFLGICLGMQLAVIEILRNVAGIKNAHSTEFSADCAKVISLMSEWIGSCGNIEKRSKTDNIGGTMRLGEYPCKLQEGSFAKQIYGEDLINERHRHRYEFNLSEFGEALEKTGTRISGRSPDETLTEIIEIPDHPWFVGVQFHPEFKSKPLSPHPLFCSLIRKAAKF